MEILDVIAVENPIDIIDNMDLSINSCVIIKDKLYLYTTRQELVPLGDYSRFIETLSALTDEGRYEWVELKIHNGQRISRLFDDIFVDNKETEVKPMVDDEPTGVVSNDSLQLFNQFLKIVNKEHVHMVLSLESSHIDGYFRSEVMEIIKNDEVSMLGEFEMKLIKRTKYEGIDYVISHINNLLNSDKRDRYMEANYFFRSLFRLERYKLINFNSFSGGQYE